MTTDMLKTIQPKSDQLNADDLIGGQSKTIKITKVSLVAGDQPIAINYEGDEGKPYKPGKSMRRVLVNVWGGDGNAYIGRSLTLYRDDKVMFGGVAVGGLRISHMSHIDKEIVMALTATRTSRKPFMVKPLVGMAGNQVDKVQEIRAKLVKFAGEGKVSLDAAWAKMSANLQASVEGYKDELYKIATEADARPKDEAGREELF